MLRGIIACNAFTAHVDALIYFFNDIKMKKEKIHIFTGGSKRGGAR